MAQLVRLRKNKGDQAPPIVNLSHIVSKGKEVSIGRDPSCEIRMKSTVGEQGNVFSRHHATISYLEGTFFIEDFSTNGTFINGLRIRKAGLKSGDLLSFGAGGGTLVGKPIEGPETVVYSFCDNTSPLAPTKPDVAVSDILPRHVSIASKTEIIPSPPPFKPSQDQPSVNSSAERPKSPTADHPKRSSVIEISDSAVGSPDDVVEIPPNQNQEVKHEHHSEPQVAIGSAKNQVPSVTDAAPIPVPDSSPRPRVIDQASELNPDMPLDSVAAGAPVEDHDPVDEIGPVPMDHPAFLSNNVDRLAVGLLDANPEPAALLSSIPNSVGPNVSVKPMEATVDELPLEPPVLQKAVSHSQQQCPAECFTSTSQNRQPASSELLKGNSFMHASASSPMTSPPQISAEAVAHNAEPCSSPLMEEEDAALPSPRRDSQPSAKEPQSGLQSFHSEPQQANPGCSPPVPPLPCAEPVLPSEILEPGLELNPAEPVVGFVEPVVEKPVQPSPVAEKSNVRHIENTSVQEKIAGGPSFNGPPIITHSVSLCGAISFSQHGASPITTSTTSQHSMAHSVGPASPNQPIPVTTVTNATTINISIGLVTSSSQINEPATTSSSKPQQQSSSSSNVKSPAKTPSMNASQPAFTSAAPRRSNASQMADLVSFDLAEGAPSPIVIATPQPSWDAKSDSKVASALPATSQSDPAKTSDDDDLPPPTLMPRRRRVVGDKRPRSSTSGNSKPADNQAQAPNAGQRKEPEEEEEWLIGVPETKAKNSFAGFSSTSSLATTSIHKSKAVAHVRYFPQPPVAADDEPEEPEPKAPPRKVVVLSQPRTAFEIFFEEQKAALRKQHMELRGADLRREINKRWSELSTENRRYYAQKAEKERDHFARANPQYREMIMDPRKAKKGKSVGPVVVPTATNAKPARGATPVIPYINRQNQSYRNKVSKLYDHQEHLARQAMEELRQLERNKPNASDIGDSQSSNKRPRIQPTPQPQPTDNDSTFARPCPRTTEMPLSKRILNVGKQPHENLETMPGSLAALLKAHQREGVQFLWRHLTMDPNPAQVATSLESQVVDETTDAARTATKGCVLAHSMGLGKSFCIVAFSLMYFHYKKGKTVLIIAPKSTLHNWRREFVMWCDKANLAIPQIWILDDKVRTLEDREYIVREWVTRGGVLILGYAMFVGLVGDRAVASAEASATSSSSSTNNTTAGIGQKRARGKTAAPVQTGKGDAKGQQPEAEADEDEELIVDGVAVEPRAVSHVLSEDEEEERQIGQDAGNTNHPVSTQLLRLRRMLTEDAPDCVVLDEGHKMGNMKSCLTRALSRIRTMQRIILTGTPIQNNLWEYFTMVNFIRPGYWDQQEFRSLYATTLRSGKLAAATLPEQREQIERRSDELYRELFKFVHRRDVSTLRHELPPLHEFVVRTSLSTLQAKVYMDFVNKRVKSDATKLQTKGILGLSNVLFRIGNHLDLARQYCVDKGISPLDLIEAEEDAMAHGNPFSFSQFERRTRRMELRSENGADFSWSRPLFQPTYRQLTLENNNKMLVLFEIIQQAMELNEKVLVFSQWATTLDVIECLLRFLPPPTPQEGHEAEYECDDAGADSGEWVLGRDYFRLDGDLSNARRQHLMDHFNDPGSTSRLLLCGMKAGGLGINLTGATRVVLFDTSWNPQAEQQAMYRAYRYGQTREVFVYHLINHGTIEDTVYQKVRAKVCLFRKVVDDQSLTWQRKDLAQLRYIGLDGHLNLPPIPSKLLELDSILNELVAKELVIDVEDHSGLLMSNDDERLTLASQPPHGF